MLRLRVLSAFIAMPIVLFVLYIGGLYALGLALLAVFIATYELWHMFVHAGYRPWLLAFMVVSLFFVADAYLNVNPALPFGLVYDPNERLAIVVLTLLATLIRETILANYGDSIRHLFQSISMRSARSVSLFGPIRNQADPALAVASAAESTPPPPEQPHASIAASASSGSVTANDDDSQTSSALKMALDNISLTLIGPLYAGLLLSYVLRLRYLPGDSGLLWGILLMLGTWGTDTGAYFAGRYFGRHRFFPRISPKKTWEGVFGGYLLATVAAALVVPFLGIPLWHILPLGIVIAIAAVMGDLAESLIKRATRVKDSGTLFPGHGGMLDRIDGLIFVATALYYYSIWFTR